LKKIILSENVNPQRLWGGYCIDNCSDSIQQQF